MQQGDLPFGEPGAGGYHRAPDPGGALMKPETAGKQAVSVSVLNQIVFADAGSRKVAAHAVGPLVHIIGGVWPGDGLAGGAGRGMHPHHLRHGHGAQAEGVIVAQVVLDRHRQLGGIFYRIADRRRSHRLHPAFSYRRGSSPGPRPRFPSIFAVEIFAALPPACIRTFRSSTLSPSLADRLNGQRPGRQAGHAAPDRVFVEST